MGRQKADLTDLTVLRCAASNRSSGFEPGVPS